MSAWERVPLEHYETHMGAEGTDQLRALAELFGVALAWRRPRSVAVLGVAGGNGLDRIDVAVTERVVGVDVNREYLRVARERFARLRGLELVACDLSRERAAVEPVELTHCALIFEHTGVEPCLENAIAMAGEQGAISVVLQLASETTAAVSPSPFESIRALASYFQLIQPVEFQELIKERGFTLDKEVRFPVRGGKALWLGMFERTESALPPRS